MLRQYFSTDKTTGYIRYYQLITEDWIRLTPTIWGIIGYSLSQGKLYSQFRLDLSWNNLIPIYEFDKLTQTLNYVFENENNNENEYRIIINSLRLVFDDWWTTYDYVSQRPPCPLFKEDKEVYIDFVSEYNEDKDEEIDKYIEHYYKIIPTVDKNGKSQKDLIRSDVKFNCFYAFLKGFVLAQYTNEMKSEFNSKNGITLTFKGKIFTTLFNELLLEYGFITVYNKYTTPTKIFINEYNGVLENCLNLKTGFFDGSEPDIFISSPSRGIREPIN